MKQLMLFGLLAFSAAASASTCYVDMVDRYQRVVRSFSAWGDDRCVEGMKECRKSIRLDYSSHPSYPNGSLDCVSASRSNPGPIYVPTPAPTPTPNRSGDVCVIHHANNAFHLYAANDYGVRSVLYYSWDIDQVLERLEFSVRAGICNNGYEKARCSSPYANNADHIYMDVGYDRYVTWFKNSYEFTRVYNQLIQNGSCR